MSNQRRLTVICLVAPSVILVALCLTGVLAALLLFAFLPGLWCWVGFTTLLLFGGVPLCGNLARRELSLSFGLESPIPAADHRMVQAPHLGRPLVSSPALIANSN